MSCSFGNTGPCVRRLCLMCCWIVWIENISVHVWSQVGKICISRWWRIGTISSRVPFVAQNIFEGQVIKGNQSILSFSSVFFTAVKDCLFSTTKCDVNRPFGADNLSQLNVGPRWLKHSQAVRLRLEHEFGFEHRHPDNSRWIVFCGQKSSAHKLYTLHLSWNDLNIIIAIMLHS